MERPERLLLLVGSNPLPNYLVASQLRPREVVLLHTSQTQEPAKRLAAALRGLESGGEIRQALIKDATSASSIFDAVKAQMEGATTHLNYTGGTKVMSAHALRAFYEAGGQAAHASYLDERGVGGVARLRFDDGGDDLYLSVGFSLEVLLGLHDCRLINRSTIEPAPIPEDAVEILCAVLADPALAGKLHDHKKRLEKNEKGHSFTASDHGLNLSVPVLPTDDLKEKDCFKKWCKFIGGEWLEEWVGEQVREVLGERPTVTVGVNVYRGVSSEEAQLEVDVVVLQKYRSFFISCTTDRSKALCKSKLLEVAVRARQLGGDLAQAALVCLADGRLTEELKREIKDVWGASNTPEVFGLEELRLWAGREEAGVRPDTETLRDWLGVKG